MSTEIRLIERIIDELNKYGTKYISVFGEVAEHISEDIIKYTAHDNKITHFMVFQENSSVYEISFYCESLSFSLEELKQVFGLYENNYNFRENYSEFKFKFKFKLNSNEISELFFIKDNKFEVNGFENIIEITPKGNKTNHENLTFNGFCFRFNRKVSN